MFFCCLGLCAWLCPSSHRLHRGACVCSKAGVWALTCMWRLAVCAYSPCSLVHTLDLHLHQGACVCCVLVIFSPNLLHLLCHHVTVFAWRFLDLRELSLSLSVPFFSLRNEVISDSVSHQCWLTAYLCCCNWSGIAVAGHCVSLLRTDCFSLVVLGHSSLNSPITAAYLFHNGLIINAHHVTSWITCFRSS